MGGATEARKGMFSIANDVSSWWANLDPGVPKPSQPSTTSSRSAAEVQQVNNVRSHVPSRHYSLPASFGGKVGTASLTSMRLFWAAFACGGMVGPSHAFPQVRQSNMQQQACGQQQACAASL